MPSLRDTLKAATAAEPAALEATGGLRAFTSLAAPPSNLHRLAAVLALLLLGFAALFSWQSWQSSRAEQVAQMTNVLAVVDVALERYLTETEQAMKLLAADIADAEGRPVDAEQARRLLTRFRQQHPGVVAVSLRQMDNTLLVGTGPMPPTMAPASPSPSFAAFLADPSRVEGLGMDLGRPVLGQLAGRWVMPMRLIVRDSQGRPAAVLTAGLPVEFLQTFWQRAPIVEKVSIGLLGDDGFLRSRYPVPATVQPEQTYGMQRSGALREHLVQAGFPESGYVEGLNVLGGEAFGNAYQRMARYRVTLFVATPTAELRRVWWQRAQVPLGLLAFFGTCAALAYRYTLRRQLQWASERGRAEQALQRSEGRYRRLFESSLDAVIIADPSGRIVDANPAACAMFGLNLAELLAGDLSRIIDIDDPRLRGLMQQRAAEGGAHGGAYGGSYGGAQGMAVALRADGTRFEAEISSSGYTDTSGDSLTSLLVRDVSVQRQAEAALRAKELAEEASKAKSAFIARMSHELRTPLNAILGFSEVLMRDARHPLDADQRGWLEQIYRAGDHLLLLISDLLDLSRIESGHLPMQWEDVDLAAALMQSIDEVAQAAEVRGITVELLPGAETVGRIRGDRTRVLQVMLNLLSNAIKYNHDGGTVRVGVVTLADSVRMTVQDSGIGMDADQVARLFRPFDRLGREATALEGTGIGLVITRSLVELMGGVMQVHSEIGKGSAFSVDWQPARSAPAGADMAPALPAAVPSAVPALALQDQAATVVYIDDDEVNRILMQASLALRPAITLHAAADGASGLELIARCHPDLVLIDLMMPGGMSGHEVLTALRHAYPRDALPCVAVSANAMPEEIEQALAEGFDAYLTKPLAIASLFEQLDRLLGPNRTAPRSPDRKGAETGGPASVFDARAGHQP